VHQFLSTKRFSINLINSITLGFPLFTFFAQALAGLEITAGQRTMSGLIGGLTGQMFALPIMLTGHIRSY